MRGGQFVITLDPKDGGQGYQGIVPIEGENVAEILQNYMQRSEQIETRIWLACDEHTAAGMLLQKLPNTAQAPNEIRQHCIPVRKAVGWSASECTKQAAT
jgi:redox-regulated HSP33 family molecular chaperone